MSSLDVTSMTALLEPYLGSAASPPNLLPQLQAYLGLLERWQARTNLTAIRDPREMVQRHFGESLFAGLRLPAATKTLLDFGSGAGFPGLPIQLLRPELHVTLAESQGKKVAFLREAVRVLDVRTEVWGGRVEDLPEGRRFDGVALRAVDRMDRAIRAARVRVERGGVLLVLDTGSAGELIPGTERSRVWIERL
jgi:16S rRNA (guanine527-N7)-methyltransferase